MKPLLRQKKQIYNFKLVLILYMILNINLRQINAAPTTNSPSKLSPSINTQQKHNQNNIELLLDDQTTQQNGDNFDQFEISTTTTIPIDSVILNKNIENTKSKLIETTTNVISTVTLPSTTTLITKTTTTTEQSSTQPSPVTEPTEITENVQLTIAKTTQKPKKIKIGKKSKVNHLKIKDESPKLTENTPIIRENKSIDEINLRKLFEKSATTTATTTAMTIENLESTATTNSFVATTNPEPILIEYLTTIQPNPLDELLNLNDQKVEEALLLTKKDIKTTEKPKLNNNNNNKKHKHIPNNAKNHEISFKTTTNTYTKASSTTTELTPLNENLKFHHNNEGKKSKLYENKKSHMTYKKKLRSKSHNFNHSKVHSVGDLVGNDTDKRNTHITSTSTISTTLPFSSTTNDITSPIFLPTTHDTSAPSISTSSIDPFSKLNTKTVNPFRHQEAIDDISVSDTVSATTLETTTIETPLAMASATSTQQTTSSSNNFQLKLLKQTSSYIPSSSLGDDNNDDIDENISKYISTSDDLITTYSTQLQSSSSLQLSTIKPTLLLLEKSQHQMQTSTKEPTLISTDLLTNDTTIPTLNEITTTQEILPFETSTINNKISKADNNNNNNNIFSTLSTLSLTSTALPSSSSSSDDDKELISISTTNPISIYSATPLRGTTKSYETSSSPTTFMARDQLKYTDDDGSNIELVTTKFITDHPKKNPPKNTEKNIVSITLPIESENIKFTNNIPIIKTISTLTTESIQQPILFENKNRLQSLNEYKIINSKKINNKDNIAVNDNNENSNFNTIVQLKDIFPYKMIGAELTTSTISTTSVGTRENTVSKKNEYPISTNHTIVTTTITPSTTTTTTAAAAVNTRSKANTLYSTLKSTFRAIHTTTGSSMEKDISILDPRIEDITAKPSTSILTSNKTEEKEHEHETLHNMELHSIKTNISKNIPASNIEIMTTSATVINTEKLIKFTDVENIDSSELMKTEAAVRKNHNSNNNKTEMLVKPTKSPNGEISNGSQTSIGHDGFKATKKKQLLDKHFKTSTEKYDEEIISITEHKLGPLRMKETVLRSKNDDTITETISLNSSSNKNNKTNENNETTTTTISSNKEANSTNLNGEESKNTESLIIFSDSIMPEHLTSPKTSTDSENESTVMLNIDLIAENSQSGTSSFLYDKVYKLKSTPTVHTKTTTESEYIKHKNYEKSLIPKLEWIPIASVEHFDFTDFSHSTISSTTINKPLLDNENSRKIKLADQISNDSNDSQTKSLEIELVEPTKLDAHQSETVPEFFEITKTISTNQNVKTNDKENSESSPIEIQINVSEGFGNENENLEFSFRQMHSENAFKPIKVAHTMQNPPPGFQEIGEITIQRSIENQSTDSITLKPIITTINNTNFSKSLNQDFNSNKANEAEEILQVEITAIDNSTGIESFNEPKFTLHSESNLNRNRDNDDFFIPDLKLESIDELKEQNRPLDNFGKDTLDRDSDTIFYISNTEVKVAESKPTPNTMLHHNEMDSLSDLYRHRNKTAAEINRSKLESQFFPTIYEEDVRIDVTKNKNSSTYNQQKHQESDRYEEDIILSPLKNNFDPLKMEINSQRNINNNNDNSGIALTAVNSADNLYSLSSSAADVSYIGETLIEIEESTNANPAIPPLDLITNSPLNLYDTVHDIVSTTKKDSDIPLGMIIAGESAPIDDITGENTSGALLSDVIIQPAVIPEMSIGVPVIGELPPQIELKEIDYIPSSTNNNGDKNSQLEEQQQQQQQQQQQSEQIDGGAIQYGGDLISDDDTSGSAGNRYVFESSYPFGDERIRKVGRLRNEQNFDNDASDIDDNDSNSSSRDDDNFNTPNRHDINKISNNFGDLNNSDGIISQQQIIMHAVNSNFQKEQFIADFPSYDTLKEIPQKRNNNEKENDDTTQYNFNASNIKNNSEEILNSTTQTIISNSYNTTMTSQGYGNSSSGNSTEPEQLGNATAFIIMDDTEGNIFDLTDIQTLLIACFATLIPLVLSLLLAFAVRYLWKKYRRDDDPDEEGGLVGDTSIDPMSSKTGVLSQDELRTTESGYTLNRSNDTLDTNATDLDGVANGNAGLNGGKIMANHCIGGGGGGGSGTINNNNNCGANGSVITMTLKNNHLIVETEERNDISRDARETKMHYNSSDKDGVFVVEVARGADTTGVPNSPYKENHIGQKACSLDVDKSKLIDCKTSSKNHEEVQIHQPPSENFDIDNHAIAKSATISELDEANFELEERGINLGNSKTGLSQSDLSSSSNDSNKGYNYGKQELYTAEVKVYNPTSPKQKTSSDSLDSIKDKSENDFGDNCDTETSPFSRECSNGSDNDKYNNTNKDSGKFTENRNSDHNYKSNRNEITTNAIECNSDGVKREITKPNDNEKKLDNDDDDEKENLKDGKNEIEIAGNSVTLKQDKEKDDLDMAVKIIENHTKEEKINQIENESIQNKTPNPTTNSNTETIEINESLPPPPPQFNEKIYSSSSATTDIISTNKQNDHKETEKHEKNKNIENDIKNSSKTSTTESEIVTILEKEKKLDEDKTKKIIHHENGLDDHHHNNSNSILTNGHYEKQNGIIHNHDNDIDDDDDDDNNITDFNSNNDTTTIIVNDDKKMNGINEDIDRTIILSSSSVGHENGFDSILSLPDPPSTEEIKQMNDIILMENSQLDSLPPPPPVDAINLTIATSQQQQQQTTILPTTGELIGNCNDELIKNSISSGNCGIDTNNLSDIKILLNGDHHNNIITTTTKLTEDEQIKQQHQNGIGGTTINGTTTTLVAVNGSS